MAPRGEDDASSPSRDPRDHPGPRDRYASAQDRYGERRDEPIDPERRYGGGQDRHRDPRDRPYGPGPGNRYGESQDHREPPAGPRDRYGAPRDRYGAPRDRYGDPPDRPSRDGGDDPGRYPRGGASRAGSTEAGSARERGPGGTPAGAPAETRGGAGGRPGGFLPGMASGERPAAGRGRLGRGRRGRDGRAGAAGGFDAEYGHDLPDDGDDGRGRPRRRGRWAGPAAALIVVLIVLVPLAIGGFIAYRVIESHYNPANYSGDGTGQLIFQVKPGDTATTVGERLVTDGVIASSRAFVLAAEHSANANALEPGFYRLHRHMNAALAWTLLLNPSARVEIKVTIPEGWRVSQVLAVLGRQSGIPASAYAKAIKDTATLGLPSYARGNPEGYLFPATYEIQPNMSATNVLQAMVTAFGQEAAAVSLPQAAAHGNLTPAQVITVASLAQAEGGSDADFPKITRVIYNRLAAGMPLDLDSTVLFALNTYGILASNAQLRVNSPYNTYTHKGLPPGPIDNPGNAAIEAALHPASGNWLYFVTVNPKTRQTVFTNSAAVFNQLKAELEQNLAHGG